MTDVLGVAPLGHLLPSGGYIRPNPEELVRLGDKLQPRNGRYVFQLTDELREVDYFDQVRLLAVDHPATEEVYSNEVFSESLGSPTLHAVRQRMAPVAARDQHGRDVLPLVRTADKEYVASFRRLGIPDRFIEHGERDELLAELGLTEANIYETCLRQAGRVEGKETCLVEKRS